MKQIFILTNFSTYLKSYSPIIVVESHLKMLVQAGYQPVLITSEGWESPEGSVFSDVKTIRIPRVPVSNDPGKDATFDEDIATLYTSLKGILVGECVVMTHDLIFLPDYTKLNVAARKLAAENNDISWCHMVHSATAPTGLIKERNMYGEEYSRVLGEHFPNSVVMFPNAYSIPRVARNFAFEEDQVFEVPHPIDLTEGMERVVQRVFNDNRIYEADVFIVYPLRLDRGKNAEMNVRLIGSLRRIGLAPFLLFCDFQSTGGDKVTYREDLKRLAEQQGVGDCVKFLSELDASATMEVSHTAILDFLTLSNVFMMPSKSETYSLVTQEAMARGNFCILNHDFAPFRQIFGDNAIYRSFSSNIGMDGFDGEITTTYSDIDGYFDDLAKAVNYWIHADKTNRAKTWVRKERNLSTVFKRYLEPLLFRETPDAEV